MKFPERSGSALAATAVLLALTVLVAACGGKKNALPAGSTQPDKFLFDRGTESLNKKSWLKAREYFQQLYDNYPQSPYRTDAKLGLGDAYLGEDNAESLVLAANEYREFLTFFPTNHRADYAQYKLGCAHYAQMLKPDRDQTHTRETIKEFEAFVDHFPNSPLMGDAQKKLRESRDRLSDHDYGVGYFYFRSRWYPGAIDRFKAILASDPRYTRRDAVYYYLAESLMKVNRPAEALPYFEKLKEEFQQSEYLVKAELRIKELKEAKG